jgi:hypothetical protein
MIREIVREVVGLKPYEKRILEMLKTGGASCEKRVYKFAKQRVSEPCNYCPQLARSHQFSPSLTARHPQPCPPQARARQGDPLQPAQPLSTPSYLLIDPMVSYLCWARTRLLGPNTMCTTTSAPPRSWRSAISQQADISTTSAANGPVVIERAQPRLAVHSNNSQVVSCSAGCLPSPQLPATAA